MNTRHHPARSRALLMVAALTMAACGTDSNDSTSIDATAPTGEAMSDEAMSDEAMSDEAMSDEMADHGSDADHGEEGHGHGELAEVTWAPVPSIALELSEDGTAWQGSLAIENFDLTDGEVDPDPVDGEGHAHLYIDGFKDRRLYETTFTLDSLDPGDHEIRVELVGNDHRTLVVDGEAIAASASVEVAGVDGPEPAAATDSRVDDAVASTDADQVIVVGVVDGSVDTQSREVDVVLGSSVAIVVTSDVAEEVHVHGYDIFGDLAPGEPAVLVFDANIPGGFEVELEGRGQLLVELVVS